MTVDWRDLFIRYRRHVAACEGVDFLDGYCFEGTDEEVAAVATTEDEAFPPQPLTPPDLDTRVGFGCPDGHEFTLSLREVGSTSSLRCRFPNCERWAFRIDKTVGWVGPRFDMPAPD